MLPILLVAILVYSNTFFVPFVFDDVQNITENPTIRETANFIPTDLQGLKRALITPRYFGHLTFALNFRLNGLDVRGYHIFNLLVHVANSVLVYLLLSLTIGGEVREGTRRMVCMLSALLFVCHPVQIQAVTYVVQRFTSLSATFFILSIALYAKWRRSNSLGFLFVSLVSAVLSAKTKETAFTLPLVIFIYELVFFNDSARRRSFYLPLFLLPSVIIVASLLSFDLSTSEVLEDILSKDVSETTRLYTTMPRDEYIFTQFRVIITYIRLLFLPLGQNLDYSYPKFNSFYSPQVLLSFLILLAIFSTAVYLLISKRYHDIFSRLCAFGILWFFITLSVESSVIPIADVIAEQRLYMPSAGGIFAAVALAFLVSSKLRVEPKAMVSAISLLVIVFSAAAYARNQEWRTEVVIWEDTARKSPSNSRAYYNLGTAYLVKGDYDRALQWLLGALRLRPDYANAHVNAGIIYQSKGMIDFAIKHFKAAVAIAPRLATARYNLALGYIADSELDKAVSEYIEAIELNPDDPEYYNGLGSAYIELNKPNKAIEVIMEALDQNPDYPEAHNNLGTAYLLKDMPEEAIISYIKALDLRPRYAEAHFNLAIAYLATGLPEKAQKQYITLTQLNPSLAARLMDIISTYSNGSSDL